MRLLGEPLAGFEVLPPLPDNLQILQAALFCGDVIAISTADGVTPNLPFILHEDASEWTKLTVH